MFLRQQFYDRITQTSEIPQGFEISHAEGCYLFDTKGIAYLDLVSGFGVNNLGHQVPEVIRAIRQQSERYLHTNVYGEHVQKPQIQLAERLASLLPSTLNSFYFLSSGSEAIDAAIKLARLATGRYEIIVCKKAYHGSTCGAESLRSDEHKLSFLPLIPGIRFIEFGNLSDLKSIGSQTAAVITEVVQAEAGVRQADPEWWSNLRKSCHQSGSLLVLDEVQTGMGRVGSLFAFMKVNVLPDLLVTGKALGAGMPLSAVIGNVHLMKQWFKKLPLAHLTTFGGHPVSCAAALAGIGFLMGNEIMESVESKGEMLQKALVEAGFNQVRRAGLFLAIEPQHHVPILQWLIQLYHLEMLVEGFLFDPLSLRVAPPLVIEEKDLLRFSSALVQIRTVLG